MRPGFRSTITALAVTLIFPTDLVAVHLENDDAFRVGGVKFGITLRVITLAPRDVARQEALERDAVPRPQVALHDRQRVTLAVHLGDHDCLEFHFHSLS